MKASLIAALAASANLLLAQEHDSTSLRLQPIVVTATSVPVASVTNSTSVITREQLDRSGTKLISEVLAELPGATVLSSGSIGAQTSVFIRGGESSYTKVLIDGVPANDPGGAYDFAHLTTAEVERIEIVRGPVSVLYGTDAVTGVIQVFTRRGSGPTRAEAWARGGSFGSYDAGLSVNGASSTAGYGLTVSQFRTDGILDFNNDYRNTLLSGSVELDPDEMTRVDVVVRYNENRFGTPTDGAGNLVDRNASTFGESTTIGASVERQLTGATRLNLSLSSQSSDGGFDDQADGVADTLGFFGFRSLNNLIRRGADLRADFDIGTGLFLSVGSAVEEQKQRSFNESLSEFGTSSGVADNQRRNAAGYFQLVGGRGPASVQAGVRVDDNDAFGTFFTYRVSAAFQPLPTTSLHLSYGTAFREPTFVQNYSTGFALGNPDLDPERTRSIEVGLRQSLVSDRAYVGVTLFDSRFEDMIEYTFAPPNPGDPNYFNVAGARSTGVEIDLQFVAATGLGFSANYTLLDTEVRDAGFDVSPTGLFLDGEELLRRPRHSASASAFVENDLGSLRVSTNYVGSRDDLDFGVFDRIELESHITVDLAARALLLDRSSKRVEAEVRVTNLFDEAYQPFAGFLAPGRGVVAGLRVGF